MAHRRSRSVHQQMVLPRQMCKCQVRPRLSLNLQNSSVKASPSADILCPLSLRLKNNHHRHPVDRDAGTTTNIPFHTTFSRSSNRAQWGQRPGLTTHSSTRASIKNTPTSLSMMGPLGMTSVPLEPYMTIGFPTPNTLALAVENVSGLVVLHLKPTDIVSRVFLSSSTCL
jgi:hypothetical protein